MEAKEKGTAPEQKSNKPKVVILDPGHGGINQDGKYQTSGKRSPIWDDGSVYYEGEGNRDIAQRASVLLRNLGWKVFYTVSPNEPKDISLGSRIKVSNMYFKENAEAFQISIHSNGYKKNVGQGAEVFTSIGQTPSDPMATIWLDEHLKEFPELAGRTDKKDGDVDKEEHLAMNKVNCPSFLIETMFHTFESECRILMSPEGRDRIARVIARTCERIHNEL